MKNLKIIWLILLIFCLVVSSYPQRKKTNYSGMWKLDLDKSVFNKNYLNFFKENKSLNCSDELKISHKEPKLELEEKVYCYKKGEDKIESEIVIEYGIFYTDARGEKNKFPDIAILHTKTKWLGNKILIRNELSKSFLTEYNLSEDKKTLTKKTYNPSNGNQILVYYLSKN